MPHLSKICYFGVILPSHSLGLVLNKLHLTQQHKGTITQNENLQTGLVVLLANVTSRSHSLYAIAHPSLICLSVVCL